MPATDDTAGAEQIYILYQLPALSVSSIAM
jgi:hypothetical protein